MNMKYLLPITFALSFVAANAVEPVANNVSAAAQFNLSVVFFDDDKFDEACTCWNHLLGLDSYKNDIAIDDNAGNSLFWDKIALVPKVVAQRHGAVIIFPSDSCVDDKYDITQEVIEKCEKEYILPLLEKMKVQQAAESK